MRIIILSDIHGNLEAFQAVLEDCSHKQAGQFYFLGDIVGYGADPDQCIEILRGLTPHMVAGNHDWAVAGLTGTDYFNPAARSAVVWTAGTISAAHASFLRTLPLTIIMPGMLLVHATPYEPETWDYIYSLSEAFRCFACLDQQICFTGHSHTPITFVQDEDGGISVLADYSFTLRDSCRYLINVGSVGQPRDGDPRAAYGIYNPENASFVLKRVPYDIRRAQEKIRAAGLPEFLAWRLAAGR